jgi:hypothetical protein
MASKALDNSNPVVHVTGLPAYHKGKPASQSAQLANLWRNSLDDVQSEDDQVQWISRANNTAEDTSEDKEDIDEQEVFGRLLCVQLWTARPEALTGHLCCFNSDLLRSITDPEHPLTLEQLAVVSPSQIKISNRPGSERVLVEFTPTLVRLPSS